MLSRNLIKTEHSTVPLDEFGLGPGQFINPGGLGVDQEDNVYATDFGEKNNVQKFDKNTNF